MSNHWDGLADTIQKFKTAVKEKLEEQNSKFHAELNDEDPISFRGLGPNNDERNEYFAEPSDVLFWHDPTAYIDELERWKGQAVTDKHAEAKQYLSDSDQTNIFARLVEALKRQRISPFVGAGLSFPCGYPLWGQAIAKLVEKLQGVSTSDTRAKEPALEYLVDVNKKLSEWDYLGAAQVLYDNDQTQLERFIFDQFDGAANKEQLLGAIHLLPKLSDGCIVTTNFDGLIEQVFLNASRAIEGYMYGTQTQNQFAAKLTRLIVPTEKQRFRG